MISPESMSTYVVDADTAAIDDFMRDCEMRNMRPGSIEGYKSRLRISSEILRKKGLTIRRLDKHSLMVILENLKARRTKNNRPFSLKNIKHYYYALSSFCEYQIWNELYDSNPVRAFQKRYLRELKSQSAPERKMITPEQLAMLINSILNPRDKAIIALFAKTGIRRDELINIDIDDIDWIEQSIILKPHPKRTNCLVFFDDETAYILRRWMRARDNYQINRNCNALFVNEQGRRLERHGVSDAVTKNAQRVGLHNPNSPRMEDHLTPHCFRHWFTTYLLRNNMKTEMVEMLRGDKGKRTIDIYNHIDKKELKRAYLAAIPVLGIE